MLQNLRMWYMQSKSIHKPNRVYNLGIVFISIQTLNNYKYPVNLWVASCNLSSTLPEIDPDTAYVVCISVSLGFPYMVSLFPCFPYMVSICPYFLIWQHSPLFWVCRCYGLLWTLHCHKDWYCDVMMMWPLLFHGIRADVSETPGNALTTRMHGDYRPSIDRFFVGFNAICYAFLINNPIYIEGRNCSFTTVPVLFNKCLGLRPSGTLSSWWLGWRRHAREGKPFFGKSLDL